VLIFALLAVSVLTGGKMHPKPEPTIIVDPPMPEPTVIVDPPMPEPTIIVDPPMPEPTIIVDPPMPEPTIIVDPPMPEPTIIVDPVPVSGEIPQPPTVVIEHPGHGGEDIFDLSLSFGSGIDFGSIGRKLMLTINRYYIEHLEVRANLARYLEKIEMLHMHSAGRAMKADTILRRGALDLLISEFIAHSGGYVHMSDASAIRAASVRCLRQKSGFVLEVLNRQVISTSADTATATWHYSSKTLIAGICGEPAGGIKLLVISATTRALVRRVRTFDYSGYEITLAQVHDYIRLWNLLGLYRSFMDADCSFIPPFTSEPSAPEVSWTATATGNSPTEAHWSYEK